MASTRLYLIRFHSRGVHCIDYRHPAVYAAVVQHRAGRGWEVVQTVLVAVVLVDWVLWKTLILRTKKGDKEMVNIEYWNGKEWVFAGGPFGNERIAWISLGGDDYNYRTIDVASGKVLTDKRIN